MGSCGNSSSMVSVDFVRSAHLQRMLSLSYRRVISEFFTEQMLPETEALFFYLYSLEQGSIQSFFLQTCLPHRNSNYGHPKNSPNNGVGIAQLPRIGQKKYSHQSVRRLMSWTIMCPCPDPRCFHMCLSMFFLWKCVFVIVKSNSKHSLSSLSSLLFMLTSP